MRTSNLQVAQQTIFLVNRSFTRMTDLRMQLSSGRRINQFSDDPRGLGEARNYKAMQDANLQYQRNLTKARSLLEATDSGLQGMSDILSKLRQVVIRETGALASDDSNRSTATEISELRNELLSLANQQVQGRYIFGGYTTNVEPFALGGSQVSYNGDSNTQLIQVGPDLRVGVSIPGSDLLGSNSAFLSGSADLAPRLEATTLLSDLNRGAGVGLGVIEITLGNGSSALVDLSSASTVADVLSAINASGIGVTASISANETGIQLVAGSNITVADLSGGNSARDLGLLGSDADGNHIGEDIRASLSDSTLFSQMRALDGSTPLGTLRFSIGGVVTDVDLSGANNLADVRSSIQSLLPDMNVVLSGGSVGFRLGSAQAFQVTSVGSDATAQLLGVVGQASPTRMFGIFEEIIQALMVGDRDRLRQSLVEIKDVHENINNRNVSIGSRQEILDQTERLLKSRHDDLALSRSRIEDTDIVDAATQLSFAEVAYQAALSSSARIYSLSLVDFL